VAAVRRDLEIHPLTPERWTDLETLFGPRGAVGGCWCMWWRLTGKDYGRQAGEPNRQAFKAVVDAGQEPGLLAYLDGEPVGWCSVAPGEAFAARRSSRSPVFRPVDDTPVWSILCFFIHAKHRGTGIARTLLEAAIGFARARGAQVLEGYPLDPGDGRYPNLFAYPGLLGMFRDAGFVEVARRRNRPVMRLAL
jgi:GNAT superfamily N-acetyltransferase